MTPSPPSVTDTVMLVAAPPVPTAQAGPSETRMRETAQEFEAVFLSQMLQPMFSDDVPESPLGGGFAEGVWRGVLADEIAKSVAESGGIGIADAVMRELLHVQEAGGSLRHREDPS